jgi:hypothetical protein
MALVSHGRSDKLPVRTVNVSTNSATFLSYVLAGVIHSLWDF